MINRIRNYINENHMIEKGNTVILGVSGGADSVCMLYILNELKEEFSLKLIVVHINHMIRGQEAVLDGEYVEKLCRSMNIPFELYEKDIIKMSEEQKLSCEEAGRNYRYQVFNQALEKYQGQKIAVAHNTNDLAETFLFNLTRGSGIRGMASIKPVRDKIIRPLLSTTREEIEKYLNAKGIDFRTDSTNETDDYSRNIVRHRVLNELTSINSKAIEHISKTASSAFEYVDYIDYIVNEKYFNIVRETNNKIYININIFKLEKDIIKKEIIRKALCKLAVSSKDICAVHIIDTVELIYKQPGKKINLPYGIEAIREYNDLVLEAKTIESEEYKQKPNKVEIIQNGIYEIPWSKTKFKISIKLYDNFYEISKNNYTKVLDYDKIEGNLYLRTREDGDFLVVNQQGDRKKLNRYFIDEKIPKEERDKVLVFAADNSILWVVGKRISEYYKVTEQTKRIIEIQMIDSGGNHGR